MIIPSLLDTDLYKFTMMQVVLHHFPGAQVEYRFKCRNPDVDLTPLRRRDPRRDPRAVPPALHAPTSSPTCAAGASSRATSSTCSASSSSTSASSRVDAARRVATREIDITIKGPWLHTILFEVPVLAIVQRGLLPQHAARRRTSPRAGAGSRAKIAQINARAGSRVPHRRLRHAAALLARVAGRGRARRCKHGIGRSSSARATSCSRCGTG